MFQNYLKLALRNFSRNRLYVLLNVLGLGAWYKAPTTRRYGPLITTLLIFLSACLNFANTTVARSNRRLREMGVRKTMGGTRGQLMGQMLLECGVVVLGCWAGWFLTKLLMDLIFKINVGVEPVTLAFGVAALFLISGLTVGFKVRQAVRTNPAEVLRSE